MNTKGYIHLLIEKKEQKWRIKPAENFLMSKEKEAATVASVSNNTDENTTIEDTTSIHFTRKNSRKLTQYKSSLDDRNCIICNEIKYEKGRKMSLLSMTLKKHEKRKS